MAAGTSSRFVPLSVEKPKGLLEVKGEILIERQIKQLKSAGINDITIVVGYKAEMFSYLKEKYQVDIVINEDYYRYNNTSSIIRVIDRLNNTYICSSDNYFPDNVFKFSSTQSFYSSLYANGITNEYCLQIDNNDNIINVSIGGQDSWYMIGHVFFNEEFSLKFKKILKEEYKNEETKNEYWEDVYIRHINELPAMKINKYNHEDIKEFDSIDELRLFDTTYLNNTRSSVIKEISIYFNTQEENIHSFKNLKSQKCALNFEFKFNEKTYIYNEIAQTKISEK